jgi:hypothetical protein
MAVDVGESGSFILGTPRRLFASSLEGSPAFNEYAVSADSRRFLVLAPVASSSPAPITVVVNWTAGLRR